MDDSRIKTEFYLIAAIDNPALMPDNFNAICDAISVQCVLIDDFAGPDAAVDVTRDTLSHIQSRGIAVLLANHADTAQSLGADGVHLDMEQDIKTGFARVEARLGKKAIVGVEVGNSRHDAMQRAEKNADYIAFSCPKDEMLDMIRWWVELFEIPSVAWRITDPEFAGTCAEAGADFIAIDLNGIELAGKSLVDALAEFQTAIDNVVIEPV